jgi:hypothetical protein
VNWELSNADITQTWGLKPNTVKQVRYRTERGPALRCDSAKYQQLLQTEKEKAKKLLVFSQSQSPPKVVLSSFGVRDIAQ